MRSAPLEILLVEDSQADIDLTKEALKDWKIFTNINVMEDGVEAMKYLRREKEYQNAVRPDLILLDLNLPKKDGREVLNEIKNDRYLKTIPVVILSTSDAEVDILKSYGLGANCYVTKPVGLDAFTTIVQSIGDFWFSVVKLPSQEILEEFEEDNNVMRTAPPVNAAGVIRVLVVEDNVADSGYLKEILSEIENPSFEITCVPTLKEAFDQLHSRQNDVIILDLGLPDSQGIETFHALQSKASHLPIIVLSGVDSEDIALTAVRNGAQDYMVKGQWEPQSLLRVLRYAIERKWADEERSQLLARERVARSDAEKAVLSRDEFLSIASHELKTPITSMKLQMQLLQKKIAPFNAPDITTLIGKSIKQSDRLVKLIENLLDISKLNAGKLSMQREATNLSEVVTDVVENLKEELQNSKSAVSVQAQVPAVGKWDRFRIEQVVVNLLTNAMKYGEGKPIQVLVESEGGFAKLTISDQGIGIAPEDQGRIFGRFERTGSTKNISGVGLGLYIARQIVDAHGGSIRLESELGKGSKFTVRLPLLSDREQEMEQQPTFH